ncbi:YciI family protein [Flavitalea flava]
MKEYVMIYRTSNNPDFKPTPEQGQAMMTEWMNWVGGIAARGQLVDNGKRLGLKEARTVSPGNMVADGPYTEIKEFINGYTTIKAKSLDEAVELAKACPLVLSGGGKVEVRGVVTPDDFEG